MISMKILFVCTGNTCRSPMAEGLARLYFPEGYELFSAGIQALDGDPISPYAGEILQEKGIDSQRHRAVRLQKDTLAAADLILTMTKAQKKVLSGIYPEYQDKIMQLGEWSGLDKEISDPWLGSLKTYRFCAEEIEEMIKAGVRRYRGNS
ncbi:MAG: low molecular weight protein arginine phosphatase [Dehalobacter sp. 4CP]|nr:low molecular weight protein arginine phosphatase [Dehalobacter sp.]NBJ15859.1 low molecular weight protein arginine phosphatase [Dehalobacter sp. 4CP]